LIRRYDLGQTAGRFSGESDTKAGVVRDIADRGGERVWACDLSFLPPGR